MFPSGSPFFNPNLVLTPCLATHSLARKVSYAHPDNAGESGSPCHYTRRSSDCLFHQCAAFDPNKRAFPLSSPSGNAQSASCSTCSSLKGYEDHQDPDKQKYYHYGQ
jgi:hypothetical protein